MSKWKLPRIEKSIISMIKIDSQRSKKWAEFLNKTLNFRKIRIHEILYQKEISVYNGKLNIPIIITKKMIGYLLGDFSIAKIMGKAVILRKLEKLRKKNKFLKKKNNGTFNKSNSIAYR